MNTHPTPPRSATNDGALLDTRGLPEGYAFRDDWEVTPRQVKSMLDRGEDFLLVDCRTPREYQIARIQRAKLVPLQELPDRVDELAPYRDRKVVVHCHHGGRSLQMTAALRRLGWPTVCSMAGGIDVWAMDVDPALARY